MTPDRKFLFACETESDQQEWITAFQKVISRPMLPQEYAGKLPCQTETPGELRPPFIHHMLENGETEGETEPFTFKSNLVCMGSPYHLLPVL